MTVHGTRSTYNKGCRCDACREASRLARARQRAAARERQVDPVAGHDAGLPSVSPWVLTAGLAGGAVWCFWHASQIDVTQSPDAVASSRRWMLTGIGLAGLAAGSAYLTTRHAPPE